MSSWRGGLGLGAVALGAAIASGSRPLGVVGLGFLLAWGATWLWTWLAERPVALSLDVRPESATEGDRVRTRRGAEPHVAGPARLELGRAGDRPVRSSVSAPSGPWARPLGRARPRAHGARDPCDRYSRGRRRRSPRPRVRQAAGLVRADDARRPTPARRARRPLLRRRRRRRRRTEAAPAACRRIRLPLGPRVRAGRVAPPRALADERPSWTAHGQGARGHVARRGGRPPRLRPGRRSSALPPTRASTRPFALPDRSCRRMPFAAALRRSCRPGRGAVPVPVRSAHAELGGAVMALAAAVPDAPVASRGRLRGIPSKPAPASSPS